MTTNTHPFRGNEDQKPICIACDSLAHLRCPRCGRAFCIDHAAGSTSSCADCARKGPAPVSLGAVGAGVGYALALGGLSSYLFMVNPILGGVVGLLGAVGGGIASVVTRKRRIRGWQPVEGNALRVCPDGGEGHRDGRRVALVGGSYTSRRRAAFQTSLGRFQL